MGDTGYWCTADRFYSWDSSTFTKRELRAHERRKNIWGEIVIVGWTTERIQNEYRALMFIRERTTIPVPKVISYDRIWGTYQLVTERIDGISLDNIIDNSAQALSNAEDFIHKVVLPQLRSLTSTATGALVGMVIPPPRIHRRDKRAKWPKAAEWPVRSAERPIFNFCHNDLAQHNILMNPDTLQVKAIIDWEYSGFYPSDFEAPFWTKRAIDSGYTEIEDDKVEDHIQFLLETDTVPEGAVELPNKRD